MGFNNCFLRQYSLTLSDELTGKTRTFKDLDIKFSVEKIILNPYTRGTVSILGLPSHVINSITVTSNYAVGDAVRKMQKKVRLYAGYGDSETLGLPYINLGIIEGYVTSARTTNPPNMWLTMDISNNFSEVGALYSKSFNKGLTIPECVENISKEASVSVVNMSRRQDLFLPNNININGTFSNILTALSNACSEINLFYDTGVVYIYDRGSLPKTSKEANDSALLINRSTGLISIDSVDISGIHFTTFINQSLPLNAWAKIESVLHPHANGVYRLIEKKFVGHYRGKEWYVKYHGVLDYEGR